MTGRISPHAVALALWLTACFMCFAQPNAVPPPESPPWCPSGTACSGGVSVWHNGVMVEGVVNYRAGADGVFDRPVVVVEGLDIGTGWSEEEHGFGQITWHDIYGGDVVNMPQGLQFRSLLDEIYDLGGDVLFVDFALGIGDLHGQAALVSHVLELSHSAADVGAPTALVGVSKGGVVARMALTSLEALGQPSCVSQFYCIDTPFDGALLPVGLQGLILGLAPLSEELQGLWQALNSPAARSLLQNHVMGNGDHSSLQAWLSANAPPENAFNFAVVNSRSGAVAGLSNDPLVRLAWGWTETVESPFFVQANRWNANVAGDLHPAAGVLLPGDLNPWSPTPPLSMATISLEADPVDWENAPGSEATHVDLLVAALSEAMPLPLMDAEAQTQATFVPHANAFGNVAWDGVSLAAPSAPRELHASLPVHHRQWVLNRLKGLWNSPGMAAADGLVSEDLHWGWFAPLRQLLPPLTTHDGAQLVIGTSSTPFHVRTAPCGGEVRIGPGSTLWVGQESTNAAGELVIAGGSTLVIETGGTLAISPNSAVRVRSHGTLRLEGGELRMAGDASLEIAHDGRLELGQNALVQLEAASSHVSFSGTLVAEPGSQSEVESVGCWEWNGGSALWVGALANFHLSSSDNALHRMHGSSTWAGPGWATVDGGGWEWTSGASLKVEANLDVVGWHAEGGTQLQPHVESHNRVRLDDVLHNNLAWVHHGHPEVAKEWQLANGVWSHGFLTLDASSAQVSGSVFHNAPVVANALASPFAVTACEFHAPWHADLPSVELCNGCGLSWLEGNRWTGGQGLRIANSSATLACNSWKECTSAVRLEGPGTHCFAPSCGGGQNQWDANHLHLSLECADLPLVEDGGNVWGNALGEFAAGTASLAAGQETWWIGGNEWDISLIDNPWQSPVDASLVNCQVGGPVEVVMAGWVLAPACAPGTPDPRPTEKHLQGLGPAFRWNVLGQRIPASPSNQRIESP